MFPTPPQKLPIDLERIDTRKGTWLVAVETISETKSGENLLVRIVLEQSVDDAHFRMRTLELIVRARDARDPDRKQDIARWICGWIESTEGNGHIDLTQP